MTPKENEKNDGAKLPSCDSFSAFIREKKAGSLGNALAHSRIVRWEGEDKSTDNVATEWWKSDRPLVIEWEKIRSACLGNPIGGIGKIRNVRHKKVALLREFMGIQPPPKKPKARRSSHHTSSAYGHHLRDISMAVREAKAAKACRGVPDSKQL